ncbi:helix-turn-helix transcriptional regulator [Longimicrobium sp.]|uniref:helix-turn-helix domain-containing protein n=1 Tax=Longimicrobium sp. TaxID=2029185 RepID=UPI002B61CF0A|nr:helix-turn-helix transcriptional regulator [Longimicrobium sp.]HSU13000.1 helix-turn-helix transcriptional regulator [Longimicrobium sp.]
MKTEERRAVGHRIRIVRERNGWRRDELARRLGVHAGSIARWETGGAMPHGYTVQRIAELGGTTAEWVRTGHGRAAAPREAEAGDTPFPSPDAISRFLGAIAPPGGEKLRKLDALDGLRRMLTARSTLPDWWYQLKEAVERGKL